MRAHPSATALVALGLGLAMALTGCTNKDDQPSKGASPNGAASPSQSGSSASSPASGRTGASGATTATPETGRAAWKPVPGSVDDTVTVNSHWRLAVGKSGSAATLTGARPQTLRAPAGTRVIDAMLSNSFAVVVLQDKQQRKPSTATVVDLASGKRSTMDGSSDVPTINGGPWTLAGSTLIHATYGARHAPCLATVDLRTMKSRTAYCAKPRHGWNSPLIGPKGISLMTFDGAKTPCLTPSRLTGHGVTPIRAGIEACKGWDSLLTPTDVVYDVITKPSQQDTAHFYADDGSTRTDLGIGNTGSLVWCGDAAYFSRDPQKGSDPARLMRWTPADHRLQVAYQSKSKGEATISAPRCGGDAITVSALGDKDDEQVFATVAK